MMAFNDLKQSLAHYLDDNAIASIEDAYQLAAIAHEKQTRFSGEPYITHPVAVAQILANMRMDKESVMAALLHDVIEDTGITKEEIVQRFGNNVAELVDGVTKLAQISYEDKIIAQAENFRKMLLAMVKDIRVIIIKLADRLHNMRTIGALPPEKRHRIAHETLDIYAPIANRLGMHEFYIELEDLCFAALNPMRYALLKKAVRKARGHRKEMMARVQDTFNECLLRAGFTDFKIYGRQKHIYSIYKKMRQKHLSFNDIMDVYAFRIVVPTIDDCYRSLGFVHHLYKPVPGRIKDYIAIPKANSYQSLHTTLFGPSGVPIEVQIRTKQMNKVAQSGISAHWRYKTPEGHFDKVHMRTRAWLQHLLDIQQETGSSLEFIENVKIDLFPDSVYVFTPKGKIIELPAKSTSVDFAYAVHTDIGNHCVSARINRQLAPLSTPLHNGQTVEILTDDKAQPDPTWLNFVASGKARSSIRNFIKDQKQSEMLILGERLLNAALKQLSPQAFHLTPENLHEFLHHAHLNSVQDLYESIGRGERNSLLVARQLVKQPVTDEAQILAIKGTEGVSVQLAKCCWPIPGDHIMGLLLPDEGMIIHNEACKKITGARFKDHLIRLEWEDNLDRDYEARLDVELENQRGVLADLSIAIAKTGADVIRIQSDNIDSRFAHIIIIVGVHDRDHLARIMRNLRKIKAVLKITRVN
ncbi:MAG: bifunctional (p)ppGpp synthetase/guanosine-3',5'-bis(diphosphate) 3'-pyrophosphohydrolase, partial [Gammaproteobacteria bacterium]|jgi:guanosine-3',5'-bis(diphosphate) 3'-pyrophosphohydrolase